MLRNLFTHIKLESIMAGAAVCMVIYHVVTTFYLFVDPTEHQNIHLGFALLLIFLVAIKRSKRYWQLKLALMFLCLASIGYIGFFYDDLAFRIGFPTAPDVIVGIILVILVLEATREAFGLVLPIFGLITIAYAFWGYYLPPPFGAFQLSPTDVISKLAVLQGMYGMILGISANYIFLFVLFGAVLQISGATRFFVQIGTFLGRRLKGGAALTAVVTSALTGMVTGSVAANIATTGSFTIPLMKRAGYKPEQAGGIEAAASTGGQFMPPVMGAAAFLMVGFTGTPYIRIIAAAAIPAILYFFGIALYTQFQAMKLNIRPIAEKVDVKEMLLTAHLFIVPMSLLIVFLVLGYTPMAAISRSLLLLVALSLIGGKRRPSLKEWWEGLTRGALTGAQIGASCAVIGIIVAVFSITGLGIKIPASVEAISGGHLYIALILTACMSVLLGCGMTVTAVYVLVVIAAAPVLVKMGLTVLQAHFFAFYFGGLSFVTPPIAVGSLIASGMAGAPFFKTALESVKANLAGFLLPFLFILCPVLLLQPQAPISSVASLISIIVSLIASQAAICDYYLIRPTRLERTMFALVALLLLSFLVIQNYMLLAVGLGIFVVLTIGQMRRKRIRQTNF